MKKLLFYCSLYGPRTKGVDGQQNLSLPVQQALSENFDATNISAAPAKVTVFPTASAVISALHRLLWAKARMQPSGAVTVVDMIHALTVLPNDRAADRLIVLGHDSYALRAARDLAAATLIRSKIRLSMSWIAWRYVEILLQQLAWRSVFVSPIDHAYATRTPPSKIIAIPVDASLRELGAKIRNGAKHRKNAVPRLLISLPVRNQTQNDIDLNFVTTVLAQARGRVSVTLWGKGAPITAARLKENSDWSIVNWVDDYAGFLSSFDLLIYPRMVGSGFHGKLAEALVLGLPCLCVDWIAVPLREAGYDGITSFTTTADFTEQVKGCITEILAATESANDNRSYPKLPRSASPKTALAPLVQLCELAFASSEERDRST